MRLTKANREALRELTDELFFLQGSWVRHAEVYEGLERAKESIEKLMGELTGYTIPARMDLPTREGDNGRK